MIIFTGIEAPPRDCSIHGTTTNKIFTIIGASALGNCPKQKPEMAQNVIPLQREASNSSTCSIEELVDQIIRPLQREVANLITCYKHNLEEAVNIRSHREASISTSDLYDAGLATSFMKKQVYPSKNLKVRQTHHEQQQTKRIPKPFSTTKIDKPFDICSPQTSEDLVEESAVVLGPGMILLKCYIPLLEQVVLKC